MTQQPASNDRRRVLKVDLLFTCSMLIACCVFTASLVAWPSWEFQQTQQIVSANATSTAFVLATQQANRTSTAIAHATEQTQYEFTDTFYTNKNKWRLGNEESEYWSGSTKLRDGVYVWDVVQTKDTFIAWSDFSVIEYIKDFDAYIDTKVTEGGPGDVCSGFLFRISLDGWEEGGYYFALCNNSMLTVSYHTEKDGWERIASIPYSGNSTDWNRLEIKARGSHFEFFINGNGIYEMSDDRQEVGSLALVIELNEKVAAEILFDNFGLQRR